VAGLPSDAQTLNDGLTSVSQILSEAGCEHFLFFGSLLGINRDNSAIHGDDDVDIYVNVKHREKATNAIIRSELNLERTERAHVGNVFAQFKGTLKYSEAPIQIDLYFYDSDTDNDFILERWNFMGRPDLKNKVLKIPKVFIFPLKEVCFQDVSLYLPKLPDVVCEFLYGVNWRTPARKGLDYTVQVVGGRPLRIQNINNHITILD
jgi:predicted nucleotidyltransferase